MVFTHDTEVALQAAADLANTALPPDELETTAHLEAFVDRYTYTGSRTRDATELRRVRDLRGPLRRLLLADRDEGAALVNEILASTGATPQLVRHDEWDWHLHATTPEQPLDVRICVETAMAMIDVVRADEHDRITVCGRDACEGVVVDLSRNRSRRYCSTRCGNLVATHAYRARRAGTHPETAPTNER